MEPIYKITFSINTDFYNEVCNKLYDMRLSFSVKSCGLFSNRKCFSISDIIIDEKKELILFIRNLLNDNNFRFSASFQTGYINEANEIGEYDE